MQLKCSFSIVIIFNCCHFATDHPHTVKTLILSLFVQMTKFKSYLSSYHPMQKASNWESGLDMERWLIPLRTSTHKRPFTQEGNYLVVFFSLVLDSYIYKIKGNIALRTQTIEFFINIIENTPYWFNALILQQNTTMHKLHSLCKECTSCISHLKIYIISLLYLVDVEMLGLLLCMAVL